MHQANLIGDTLVPSLLMFYFRSLWRRQSINRFRVVLTSSGVVQYVRDAFFQWPGQPLPAKLRAIRFQYPVRAVVLLYHSFCSVHRIVAMAYDFPSSEAHRGENSSDFSTFQIGIPILRFTDLGSRSADEAVGCHRHLCCIRAFPSHLGRDWVLTCHSHVFSRIGPQIGIGFAHDSIESC